MTRVAEGPNGQPMISLAASDKIKVVEDQQLQVILNLKHDAADRTGDREKIKADKLTVEAVLLDQQGPTRKSITDAWAIPRQIPDGPHMGKWYIPVPANDRLREQRDPKSGAVTDDTAPAWKSPEIVESNPAWFPSEDV